jgi:zinc protease
MQNSLMKGTESRSAHELNLAIDRLGGIVEVDNARDFVSVESLFLARDLDEGFDIVSDVVLDPAFEEEEIEKVKAEVTGSIAQDEDDAFFVALNSLRLRVFGPDHHYGRPYQGREEVIASLNRDDIRRFHERVYNARETVVCVVGDVEEKRVRRMIEDRFGGLSGATDILPEPRQPSYPKGIEASATEREKSQVILIVARPGPAISDDNYAAAVLLEAIIGGNTYSRLYQSLRERMGLAYVVYSVLQQGRYPALFMSYIGTSPEHTRIALDGIREEYRKLLKEGLTAGELEGMRTWLRGERLLKRQGNRSIANNIARNETAGVHFDFELRLLDRFKSVGEDDIKKAAGRYCDPDNLFVSICGPLNEQEPLLIGNI